RAPPTSQRKACPRPAGRTGTRPNRAGANDPGPGDLGPVRCRRRGGTVETANAAARRGERGTREAIMRAEVGDRLVRDSGGRRRVCEIVRLNHADGSPPYVVRWLSDG